MSKSNSISKPPARRGFDLLGVFALILCLPLIALSQYIAHARIDDIDAWFFLHYGRELLSGATLYADLWDIKPPSIFWINALGLGMSGGSPIGVWAFCGLAVIATATLFYRVIRRVYGTPTAAIGTVFAVMYLNHWTFHAGGNRPATFLILTELGTMLLYLRYITRGSSSNRSLFWIGLCGGLGLWFKQTAFAAPAAIFIHLLIARPDGTASRRTKVSCFVTGYLASIVSLVMVLAFTSDLRWAWDAIVGFNQNFFAPGIATSAVPSMRWMLPHGRGMELMLILAAATLAAPIFNLFRCKSNPLDANNYEAQTQPPVLLLYWMWMLIALYLSAIGPHNRPMYLAVALPPLVMLATHSVSLLMKSVLDNNGRTPPHYIIVGVLWFAFMLWTPLQMQIDFAMRQYHWTTRPVDPNVQATVEVIQQYTDTNDTIFLSGYAPELYWRANRRQAIRYLGTEKIQQLKQHGQPLMDETTRCLMAASPRVIMFDFKRWHEVGKSNFANVEVLESWVRQNYDKPEFDRFPTLWVRRNPIQ
ncbi:MAG: hypothetical protein DHS20C16_01740 [Phycisphaerae bacterium]|nr:MAG: hypothetical protein DHS20C16_01740 [Phycisphaerae bacterium]